MTCSASISSTKDLRRFLQKSLGLGMAGNGRRSEPGRTTESAGGSLDGQDVPTTKAPSAIQAE